MRPGEKLYEELLIDSESKPTANPRINRAIEKALDLDTLSRSLEILGRALEAGEVEDALSVMKSLVPEYTSTEYDGRAGSSAG